VSEVNLLALELQWDDEDRDGYHVGCARTGPLLGAEQLGLSVYELPPGNSVCPYHYEPCCEEWLVVLTGTPTLRTPDGEQELRPWDAVFFPPDETGAHKVTNRGDEPSRVAMISTKPQIGTAVYPDSNKIGIWPPGKLFKLDSAVDYFDGEP